MSQSGPGVAAAPAASSTPPSSTSTSTSAQCSSGRSSVSSLASTASKKNELPFSGFCTSPRDRLANLNQAMAIVTGKWDRELMKKEQDITRKLTVLKQRKISAVLKVRGLLSTEKGGFSHLASVHGSYTYLYVYLFALSSFPITLNLFALGFLLLLLPR